MESTDKGWEGSLELEFANQSVISRPEDVPGGGNITLPSTSRQTQIIHSHTTAPLKVQRPFYPEGCEVCHSVMLHTAGGMVGGDRLQHSIKVHPNAHALVTTAAASKVYRSSGANVVQTINMQVGAEACLEWLPQDLILFDGARYMQHLRVDLEVGAHWFGWDITRLGRTVRGEQFNQGQWRSRLEIWQDSYPLFIDPQYINGGSEMLTSDHGLANYPVIGTFVFVGQSVNRDVIEQARQCWGEPSNKDLDRTPHASILNPLTPHLLTPLVGVSQLQSGMICRYRGGSTVQARRWFLSVWDCLRQTYLSRPGCPPRVWGFQS